MLLFYYKGMAQVRKYQNSGKIEQPELFERKGISKYNKLDLILGLYTGIDKYAKDNNLKDDEYNLFRTTANQFINGIKDGSIIMNSDGTFTDTTGKLSSTGKFDKNFFGKVKVTTNNAVNMVGDFAKNYIQGMTPYKEPEPEKTPLWNLDSDLAKLFLGSQDFDLNAWSEFSDKEKADNLSKALLARLNAIKANENLSDWDSKVFDTRDVYLNRLQAAYDSLKDGYKKEADYSALRAFGIDPSKYLYSTSTPKPTTPQIEGRTGTTDSNWNNSEFDRTIDDKGKYHLYIKGTNQEVPNGLLPGNVYEGIKDRYVLDGQIYDDSNFPDNIREDIRLARLGQLGLYSRIDLNNPFTRDLYSQGYKYLTNLTSFAPGLQGDTKTLYGAYSDPADTNSKVGFYLYNDKDRSYNYGNIQYNPTLGEYQFIGQNGVVNLGLYNKEGSRTNNKTNFVNFNDLNPENFNNIFNELYYSNYSNASLETKNMVQQTLKNIIQSSKTPLTKGYDKGKLQYGWQVPGTGYMTLRLKPDGTYEYVIDTGFPDNLLKNSTNASPNIIRDPLALYNGWVKSRKLGGTIKAQLGVKFTKSEDTLNLPIPKQLTESEAKQIEDVKRSYTGRLAITFGEAVGSDRTRIDKGMVIKNSDKARLAAAITDLVGVGLGFVPGANIASAITGAGASLTEFGADWSDDGLSWGDVGKLGMNLGMDALSLIPMGKTVKAGRALNTLAKSVPLLMTAINTANFLDPNIRSEYFKTLLKITNGESFNTGDYKNLAAIASTVLMGKNLAQSRKGFWNTSINSSNKQRVTATIGDKKQTLELDNSFFDNTKGSKQVQEIQKKFAEQYNKANKLEGDNAIKPEDVTVDTKYFGRRPQTEKVEGTKNDGNWLVNNAVGKYFLGYKDPSKVLGDEKIPLSDAWFFKKSNKSTNIPNTTSAPQSKELVRTGKRNEFEEENKWHKEYLINLFKLGQLKRLERVPKINDNYEPMSFRNKRLPAILTKTNKKTTSSPELIKTAFNKGVEEMATLNNIVIKPKEKLALPSKGKTYRPPYIGSKETSLNIVSSLTIPQNKRLDQFLEDLIPGGQLFGRARTKRELDYRNIFYPVVERELNLLWNNLYSNKNLKNSQANLNERASNYSMKGLILERQAANNAAENVRKQIAKVVSENVPKKMTSKERKKKQGELEATFNLRKYDMEEALRNRELPHKKSNKKKKTSKDTRVLRRLQGGIIGTQKPQSSFKFSFLPEDLLAAGRMIGGLVTNKKVADKYKEGLKPTLLSTYENIVPILGNFFAKASAQELASLLESFAGKPRTSDASLLMASLLEANNTARQLKFLGDILDAEAFYKSRQLSQQESDAAKARRVETANKNQISRNQINAAKKLIDASKIAANYQLVLAPYLSGIEYRYRLNRSLANKYNEELRNNQLSQDYNVAMNDLIKQYGDNPEVLNRELQKLQSKAYADLINYKRSSLTNPWLIQFGEKGTKLSYKEKLALLKYKDYNKSLRESEKRFHKTMQEDKKEFNKLLTSVSSLTAELIKKAMS